MRFQWLSWSFRLECALKAPSLDSEAQRRRRRRTSSGLVVAAVRLLQRQLLGHLLATTFVVLESRRALATRRAITTVRTLAAVAPVFARRALVEFHAGRTLGQRLHRQLDATLFIGLENLDLHDLAFAEVVGHLLDALVRDLADMEQAILAGQQVDERAEVQDLRDRTLVDLADLDFRRDLLDALLGLFGLRRISRGDGDGAVFVDVDLRSGFLDRKSVV